MSCPGPENPLAAAFGVDMDERGNYKVRTSSIEKSCMLSQLSQPDIALVCKSQALYQKSEGDFQTSNPKARRSLWTVVPLDFRLKLFEVFAAGDCRRGQSLVVWAIKASEERLSLRRDRFLFLRKDVMLLRQSTADCLRQSSHVALCRSGGHAVMPRLSYERVSSVSWTLHRMRQLDGV